MSPDHYTIYWLSTEARYQHHFNQALKQEFTEHGGREAVNRLQYSCSGSAVLLLLSFLSPGDSQRSDFI